MTFFNTGQIACKMWSTWDLKNKFFLNFQIVNKLGQKNKSLKNRNFRTIQVIHINFISLESDLRELYKYINTNPELLNMKNHFGIPNIYVWCVCVCVCERERERETERERQTDYWVLCN